MSFHCHNRQLLRDYNHYDVTTELFHGLKTLTTKGQVGLGLHKLVLMDDNLHRLVIVVTWNFIPHFLSWCNY